jgi:uncharacterized repeat protein (TIGR03943 family)
VNRLGRAAVIAALATVTVRLLASGDFGRYVQQRMRWPLILAAIVLVGFAVHEALRAAREERQDLATRHRRAAPTIGWLLLAPAVVVVAVVPGGLGATAANRVDAYTATDRTDSFAPLDTTDGPVEMRMIDFIDRSVWDPERSLTDVPVRLTGIVVNDPDLVDGFRLTRFLVSCCAADGIPLQVDVSGLESPLPDDTWVTATVVWQPPGPEVELGSTAPIRATLLAIERLAEPPSDPYESPF